MMSRQDIQAIFDGRLKGLIAASAAPLGGLPVAWGNRKRPKEDKGNWLRANLFIDTSNEESIGESPIVIRRGAYVIGVFVPTNQGEKESNQIQKALEDEFGSKTLSGDTGKLRAGAANPVHVSSDDGGWYHVNLGVPFFTLQ